MKWGNTCCKPTFFQIQNVRFKLHLKVFRQKISLLRLRKKNLFTLNARIEKYLKNLFQEFENLFPINKITIFHLLQNFTLETLEKNFLTFFKVLNDPIGALLNLVENQKI